MPVTAGLSQKFYDKFGEDLAQKLVDWFNQVDATYRSDLRELNELNFARFDAKLEQRVAALDAKLERRIAEVKAALTAQRAESIKWMFVFWVGTVVPLAGLILAMRG